MADNPPHGHGDTPPAELESLHLRLLADGADWRAEFPPSEGFLRRVEAFGRSPAHAQQAARILPAAGEGESGDMAPDLEATARGAPSRRRSVRRRGFVAVAAAAVVAALFAVVFQLLPTNNSSLTGTWQTIGQLQSHQGEGVAVARSDPRVVYRLNHRTLELERSGDGGATWHAVALPPEVSQSAPKPSVVIDINPLAANTVYLMAYVTYSPSNCIGPYSPAGQGKRDPYCSVQYVSTDGGARWQRLQLPDNGRLTGMLSQVNGIPFAPLLPQEDRVYSLMTVDDFAGTYRLVASTDGVNWHFVDGDLADGGLQVDQYVVTPTGATVWVMTTDGALWRSDDSGSTWARTGNLPQDTGLAAAVRTANGASFLYVQTYSPPLGDIAPADVRVSADGGETWESAPARGVPEGQHAAPHSAMVRADGTLVMLFRTPQLQIAFDEGMLHDAAFYAWKPGAKAWTRLTPTFDAEAVEQRWLAPASGGSPETIWALVYRDDNLTYEGNDNYIKDGTYTIVGCALG